jgi:hypothetical protein
MFPSAACSTLLASFIAGYALTVSQSAGGRNRKSIQLERLEQLDEVWMLCHRKPGAGWRLAARFIERDGMAIFRVYDKRDIGRDYTTVANDVIADWQNYFGTIRPHSGDWVSGYLTGTHHDFEKHADI